MSYIKARVLCVGEAMVELSNTNFATNSTSIGIAGDTLNTAIYIKRLLGDQVVVDYLTVLGVDFYSDQILNYISSEGVGTEKIRRISSSGPGIYAISTDKLGERSFSYWRDNSAAKTLFGRSVDFESMLGYDFIYFSGISLAILAQRARDDFQRWVTDKRGDISFFFDSNYRKTLWLNTVIAQSTIEKALRNSTIAFASLDDHKQLTGQNNEASIVNGLKKSGATQVVLKRGEDGPLLIGKTTANPSFERIKNVVDSTAAGDSFNAGFIASYLQGHSYLTCAEHGHMLASKVLQYPGAVCPMSAMRRDTQPKKGARSG